MQFQTENNPDKHQCSQMAEKGFSAAVQLLEEAYGDGNPESIKVQHPVKAQEGEAHLPEDWLAVRYLEGMAAPAMRRLIGLKTDINPDAWRRSIKKDFESDLEDEKAFRYAIKNRGFGNFRLNIAERFEREEFDYAVGVFSSGIPFLFAATSYLEAEEVVIRYSHRKRDDEEVKVTDTMSARENYENSDVLILDDFCDSGETLKNTAEYILNKGPDSVTAMTPEDELYNFRQTEDRIRLMPEPR
jgi:adenine/guanine phosphoribosyltransferase-like PRPP-binding protein